MAVLNDEQRRYVVKSLARFNSLTQTVKLLQDEFGVTVTKGAVAKYRYDAAYPDESGASLTAALRKLFIAERKRYIEDEQAQPPAHKAVRLAWITELYEEAQDAGNAKLKARAIDLSIKEMRPTADDDKKPDAESDELWKRLMAAQAQALAQAQGGEK